MAEVARVLLSPVVQVFFERMESGEFVDFFREQKFIEGLLQKLKIALLSVSALLEDAVKKQLTNPAVKEWLYKLKDAVYDAEDILYEIATEALRRYDHAEAFLSEALQRKSSAAESMKDFMETLERHDIARSILPRKLDTEFQATASKVRIVPADNIETHSDYEERDDIMKDMVKRQARQKYELAKDKYLARKIDELEREGRQVAELKRRQMDEMTELERRHMAELERERQMDELERERQMAELKRRFMAGLKRRQREKQMAGLKRRQMAELKRRQMAELEIRFMAGLERRQMTELERQMDELKRRQMDELERERQMAELEKQMMAELDELQRVTQMDELERLHMDELERKRIMDELERLQMRELERKRALDELVRLDCELARKLHIDWLERQMNDLEGQTHKYLARQKDELSRQKGELDIVLDELEYLARQKDVLDLKEGVGGESLETLPTTSLDEESGIFGRDADKENIINLLLSTKASGTDNMRVIGIVGMVGIGKTTLAQLVYKDPRVESHFELQAWVCFSPVTSLTCDIWFLTRLQLALQEKLMGEKFLLVLDDVSENYADWMTSRNPFEFGAPGSMVIVTTRNHHVASIMHASETYYLKELQDENCWSLFARNAFQGNSDRCEAREVIGKQIIKKCKGNPLAAKTIGALLQSKVDVAEWEKVNSELSDLSNVEEPILLTLISSYRDLPLHLKRCFAYCSIFPMNYVFQKRQLILLWMAEHLLLPFGNRHKTMEEVGDDYFRALESKSLFQQASGDKSHFVLHAFANHLASFASWQFNFRLEADNCHPIGNKTRHFSYLPTRFDKFEKFEALYQANRLRTFLPLNTFPWGNYLAKEVLNNLLPELRCLRVLSLAHYDNVTELPESIGKIKPLRYLNLSFTGIKRLPDSICKLWNLQTLNLSGCQYLDVLPKDMCELVNLRHLDITRTAIKEMPMQLGSLKYLQTLSGFIISKPSGACIEELGKLSNLQGSLSIFELQNFESPTDAMDVNLRNWNYLEELVLEWKGDTNAPESQISALDRILPYSELKSFTINGYGGKSLPVLGSFCNTTSLRLENCKFCLCLPPLGELPSLQDLSIFGFEAVVKVDIEFYGSSYSPFEALKILRFEQMLNWEEWSSILAKSFPRLEELYILKCPKLTGGLPIHLPLLAKLEINECPKLSASLPSAPNVREMRLTHCNALLNNLPTGMQIFVVAGFNAMESLAEGILDSNSHLQELRIKSCSSLMKLSTVGLPSTLKILEVTFCEKLELPMCTNYPSLERLLLTYGCDSLRSIQLELFPKLYEIKICGCRNLESLTAPGQYESDLVTLEIRDCPYFVSFPNGGLRAPKLTSLCIINCGSLRSLPDKMQILLPSLQKLRIQDCPEVEPFLEGAMPSYLKSISIDGCDKLNASGTGRGLQKLPSVKHLVSSDKPEDEKSFPKA